MGWTHDTVTKHIISTDVPDDLLGKMESDDLVTVILRSRTGSASVTLTYPQIRSLLGETPDRGGRRR